MKFEITRFSRVVPRLYNGGKSLHTNYYLVITEKSKISHECAIWFQSADFKIIVMKAEYSKFNWVKSGRFFLHSPRTILSHNWKFTLLLFAISWLPIWNYWNMCVLDSMYWFYEKVLFPVLKRKGRKLSLIHLYQFLFWCLRVDRHSKRSWPTFFQITVHS